MEMDYKRGEVVWIEETDSTNSYVSGMSDNLADGVMVCCRRQTSGRGQRGNVWESAPGLNVTGSIMLRPEGVHARCQFRISEAVALGTACAAEQFLTRGERVMVKWPNDIYVDDRKLCGILIENTIGGSGNIVRSVAGIGLNVNQTKWRGDAPNPVSLLQLRGETAPLSVEEVADRIVGEVMQRMLLTGSDEGAQRLHEEYMSRLWRGTGLHQWRDELRGGVEMCAEIAAVAPDGTLLLRDEHGIEHAYGFKEVTAVL